MALAASDWSPVEKILVRISGRGNDSQLSCLTLMMAYLTLNQVQRDSLLVYE